MSSIRIPLAFHSAFQGYSWHWSKSHFSETDLSLIDARLISGDDAEIRPIACVFTHGDRVFFARHLKAANYDSNMRTVDYHVVGVVPKYEATNIDFRLIFQHEVFVRPIPREDARANKFPPNFEYVGGGASGGVQPSEGRPEPVDPAALSSIGDWIAHEDGDVIVYIGNDIAKPIVEVKIERKVDRTPTPSSGEDVSNEFSEETRREIEGWTKNVQDEGRNKRNFSGEDCQKRPKTASALRQLFERILGRLFGRPQSINNGIGISSDECHDYTLYGGTQVDRPKHHGRHPCPHCNGTGWVND